LRAEPPRLSSSTLDQVKSSVEKPGYDRNATGVGIVHLGPGAFHRAHQAAYFDDLLATDPRWGICEVALKTPGVRDALEPQDGLYALALLDTEPHWRVIGAIRELIVASEAPEQVRARLASPETRLVTLTVTEKGYCLTGDGELDLQHPDIRHDLRGDAAPISVIGWLVEGLRARRDAGTAAFAVMSCDNLADNGRKLGAATMAFAAQGDLDLARWIEREVRFPRTMVDAITPATDAALRARTVEALGLADAWPVQREVFSQWVVEDILGSDGPDWDRIGVIRTDDVGGYDRAKLRLLNGAHSSLAYLGPLRGHETVSQAMADGPLEAFVGALMRQDIRPSLTPPRGLNLEDYIAGVLARFRNPAIRHLLSQIAWDGSQKLPVRLLATIREALEAGRPVERLAMPIAAWMRFIRARALNGEPPIDPLAATLMGVGRACWDEPGHDVPLFLALEPVFGRDLPTAPAFRRALEEAYGALLHAGTLDPLI
jgi:fructuronate reductase